MIGTSRRARRLAGWLGLLWLLAAPLVGLPPAAAEAADRPALRQQSRERGVRVQRQRQLIRRRIERRREWRARRAAWLPSLSPEQRRALIDRVVGDLDEERGLAAPGLPAEGEGASGLSQVEREGLRRRLSELDPESRRRLREQARTLRRLPPEERAQLARRLRRFLAASPEERERLRSRAERFRSLSPGERDALRERWREWGRLPPDERRRTLEELVAEDP